MVGGIMHSSAISLCQLAATSTSYGAAGYQKQQKLKHASPSTFILFLVTAGAGIYQPIFMDINFSKCFCLLE